MRIIICLTGLLALLACESESTTSDDTVDATAAANQDMSNVTMDMGTAAPCGPSTCGACQEGCSNSSQCVDGTWQCGCDCTGVQQMSDAATSPDMGTPAGDMGTQPVNNPRVTEIATELDMICRDDCLKDIMCNPAQAPTEDECVQSYCDYRAFYANDEDSEALIACLNADVALSRCVATLNCDDYTRYYYSDQEENLPCAAEESTYDEVCDGFVE